MCAVTALFRVSVPAVSIFFNVMPCVMSTLIVDREDEGGLSYSRGRLLMDRHFLFILRRLVTLFSGSSSSPIMSSPQQAKGQDDGMV